MIKWCEKVDDNSRSYWKGFPHNIKMIEILKGLVFKFFKSPFSPLKLGSCFSLGCVSAH